METPDIVLNHKHKVSGVGNAVNAERQWRPTLDGTVVEGVLVDGVIDDPERGLLTNEKRELKIEPRIAEAMEDDACLIPPKASASFLWVVVVNGRTILPRGLYLFVTGVHGP